MIKQVIIPNGTDYNIFCLNVVQVLSENGFGTYSYSGSNAITFNWQSGDGIFGDKSDIYLYYENINNPYVLTYDTERQFAIICRQNYMYVGDITLKTFGKIIWNKDGELQYIHGSSIEQLFKTTNVCFNTDYSISTNKMQLVPFFNYLTHVDDLFISMYNSSSSGVVVTDGINRFLCCGGIIFLKI